MWSSAMLVGDGVAPWAFFSDLASFGAAGESAIWEAGTPRGAGAAALSSGPDRRRWEVSAPAAGTSLAFFPRAMCTESSGLGPTAMRHALVVGRFEGRLRGREIDVPGLCEARSFG
jgi:hypothetical protein